MKTRFRSLSGVVLASMSVGPLACATQHDEPARPMAVAAPSTASTADADLAKFHRLAKGMTYDQVTAVMGSAGERTYHYESDGFASESWRWAGPASGAEVLVTLVNGKVDNLTEFNLS